MSLTRRQFLWSAAASSVLWPYALRAQTSPADAGVFRHGVASGDPLTDRVMLWTRVTSRSTVVDVRWRIGTDPALAQVVGTGMVSTDAERDFTVKVDAGGLLPGRRYFYAFEANGERSPVGQTKTLPSGTVDRVRLAQCSCSNYPAGFFNVYRCIANRDDLDAVVHLGDYIYEFENGVYGDGTDLLRIPEPRREAVTLSDYRIRYATYRSDPDLQEAHRVHPFIVVWDDHELTNDAWSGGAGNHNPELGEGDWPTRRAAAYRAYLEWMPIRESGPGIRLYRSFRFGTLVDLLMLDTRGLRDAQVPIDNLPALMDPGRSILGDSQQQWLFDALRASHRNGTRWRVLGQQVMFSRIAPPARPVLLSDTWDGYQVSREHIFDLLQEERIPDVAILTGDIHSSWAFDVPRNPWAGYQARTGAGSLAVELITPAISSPPLYADPALAELGPALKEFLPHLKLLDGENRGYVLIEITPGRLLGEWYHVPTVYQRSAEERRAAAFVCERGSSRLRPA